MSQNERRKRLQQVIVLNYNQFFSPKKKITTKFVAKFYPYKSLKLLLMSKLFMQAWGITLLMNRFLHVACSHSTSYLLIHSRKSQASVDERIKNKTNI